MSEDAPDVLRPGAIVQLCEPYKPDDLDVRRRVSHARRPSDGWRRPEEALRAWQAWPGFSHGIVVGVSPPRQGEAERLARLHLYAADLGLIYMGPRKRPVAVELPASALVPWADADGGPGHERG